MRTSIKAFLAAAGAGIALASCAAQPYDYGYGYGDSGYPAYGYYGYEPGYYVGPSVDYGSAYYYDRDHNRHWRDERRDGNHHRADRDHHWGDGDRSGPPPDGSSAIPCCGPGSGPGGSPTQGDINRWGAGG